MCQWPVGKFKGKLAAWIFAVMVKRMDGDYIPKTWVSSCR